MADMSKTIIPKSDQLNADDFMSGSRTVKVAKVVVKEETGDQPLWVYLEGEPKRPYKPCLSMRRVLSEIWGFETDNWLGRQLTLYRDGKVIWAGLEAGGIRITHMSDMKADKHDVMLTVTRGKRAPYRVLRLDVPATEPKAAKPPGNIEQALRMIAGTDKVTIETVLAKLREFAWTKDESRAIKEAADKVNAKTVAIEVEDV